MKLIKYSGFVLYVLTIWPALAESYTVAAYAPPNPPHNILKMDRSGKTQLAGRFVDIFERIEQLTGDKFTFVSMPVARALREFDMGNIDIEPGVSPNWRRYAREPGLYSVTYGYSEEVVVFRSGESFPVTKPDHLFGLRVGVVRGFTYPRFEEAFALGQIEQVFNLSQDLLIQQLERKRIDQVFIGKATIEYMKKSNRQFRNLVIGDTVSSAEVMMRVHPTKLKLLPRLNKALRQMINDKSLEKIDAKYR